MSSGTGQGYHHEALPTKGCIRLLHLLPGTESEQLECRLEIVEINSRPEYEAISYVWGEPTAQVDIRCHGERLKISRNLEGVLRTLRNKQAMRMSLKPVWADGICIDQNNVLERSHQVEMMSLIYKNATMVYVSLGPGKGNASLALAVVNKFNVAFTCWKTQAEERKVAIDKSSVRNFLHEYLITLDKSQLANLNDILERPWFSRTWILQEIGLARNALVLCDGEEIGWEDLMVWARMFVVIDLESSIGELDNNLRVWRVGTLFRKTKTEGRSDAFLRLLRDGRPYQATDPRDKVYAFLGHPAAFREDGYGLICDVDYQKSIVEIYYEVAARILERSGNLEILSAVQHPQTLSGPNEGLSTWVPRWDNWLGDTWIGNRDSSTFHASGVSSPKFSLKSDARYLQIRGFRLDTTISMSKVLTLSETDLKIVSRTRRGLISALEDIWRVESGLRLRFAVSEVLKALGMAISAGGLLYYWRYQHEGHTPEWIDQVCADFISYLSKMLEMEDQSTALWPFNCMTQNVPGAGDAMRYQYAAVHMCANRRVFITTGGNFGLGPQAMQLGDVICVLFGGAVPFILRPRNDHYLFVGECYLHGVMYSEAMDAHTRGDLPEEIFELR